jgi:hypothetical protein
MTGSKRSRPHRDDYTKRLESLLSRYGVEDYRFERRRKHRALVVMHQGRTSTIIFPVSPSDRRGLWNTMASLRRALAFLEGRT